jgi:hypothetical protein
MHTYEHGERVHICGGPVEVPCPGCGRPACETAPDADGVIINGPTRVTFRCRCGRRWLTDDGWYIIDTGDGTQAAPWPRIAPADAGRD